MPPSAAACASSRAFCSSAAIRCRSSSVSLASTVFDSAILLSEEARSLSSSACSFFSCAVSVSVERSSSVSLACSSWKSWRAEFWFSLTFSTVEIWLRKSSVSSLSSSLAAVSR